ncbi:hypothetical protein DFH09DRAFT_1323602 [Mycena vulgaris]|nr:hypothetical protein DFH09DRAFT_1323602 [Mycena vulgaris]
MLSRSFRSVPQPWANSTSLYILALGSWSSPQQHLFQAVFRAAPRVWLALRFRSIELTDPCFVHSPPHRSGLPLILHARREHHPCTGGYSIDPAPNTVALTLPAGRLQSHFIDMCDINMNDTEGYAISAVAVGAAAGASTAA